MVLAINGIFLFIAMAAMWIGICGGLAALVDFKYPLRFTAPALVCAYTALLAASIFITSVLPLSWFNNWRHFSTLLVPLIIWPFVSYRLPAFIFTVLAPTNMG